MSDSIYYGPPARTEAIAQAAKEGENLSRVSELERDLREEREVHAECCRQADALRVERDEARADRDALRGALRDALDLADEGWTYADQHYREKWDYAGRAAAIRSVLAGKDGECMTMPGTKQ